VSKNVKNNSPKRGFKGRTKMKRLTLSIPLLFIFVHLMYADFGLGIWTTDFTTYGRILSVNVNPSPQTTVYAGSLDSGVVKSTDAGLTWFTSNTGLTYNHIQSLAICTSNPNVIYVGTDSLGGFANCGVYKTTNGGNTWTLTSNAVFQQRSIQAIVVNPTNPNIALCGVFNAGSNSTDGIYRTTDGGTTWAVSNSGFGANKNILALAMDPSNPNVVYAGTSFMPPSTGPTYVYKSTDGGVTWTNSSNGLPPLSTDINPVRTIDISTANTQYIAAGLFQNTTTGGFYWSTNGGALWTKMHTGLPSATGVLIRAVLFRPNSTTEIYCAIDAVAPNAGVWRTVNGANSWVQFVNGTLMNSYLTRTLSFRATPWDSTLYTGVGTTVGTSTPGQGVYEYSHYLVGVSNSNGRIPKEFALYQNFPNPFNPATYITYDIPRESFVTLKIYDISGREVGSLVNETKQPGSYQILFNASSLSSGVYFYTISAGNFLETKKMIITK